MIGKRQNIPIYSRCKKMTLETDVTQVIVVRAKHNFNGRNNDELCFKKGDVIVVTQILDEGWWEGTLNDKTGWFPSNYVTVEKQESIQQNRIFVDNAVDSNRAQESRHVFRDMVLRNMLENEEKHLNELVSFLTEYINPLKASSILSKEEFVSLIGNIREIIQFQSDFYNDLLEESRIGGKFLRSAQTLKQLLASYCKNHPMAVNVIDKHRTSLTQFMQNRGANDLLLVSRLSQPFRHLDSYTVALLELERNLEDNHPDRGDTQRAVSVYRDVALSCAEIRKQKEIELDLLTCTIADWEGEPMHMLGDFISAVTAYSAFGKSWEGDCCLVLFPQVLLVLQVSPELNGYTYKADPGRHMIEIRSKLDDKTVLSFTMSNPDDLSKWLDRFETLVNDGGDDVLISPIVPSSYVNVEEEVSPLMKPKLSNMPSPGHAELFRKPVDPGKSLPPKQYSGYCLRPLPTQLRTGGPAAKDTEIKLRKKGSAAPAAAEVVYDSDEIELLKVVEMFCGGDSLKPMLESKSVKNPGILIAEDEKIFFEEFVGDELVVHEKTLVDTVYALKDQVRILSEIVNDLTKTAQSEQSARRRTDELMCQLMNERTSNSSTLSNYTKD
ncbi:Rho guanine nucleotide exchange factor 7 [Trichinella pseudospiralis]|uniref:Rho guanine nucleotide exchange factor 7 n=1 Tax=Trichinella pseudospiralis TaxID=6337 RepID=A0A0V1JPD2_TRIPS|nr:Rho guanine nucleotide exchange factor 7 [Trichinella pseudospiralis]